MYKIPSESEQERVSETKLEKKIVELKTNNAEYKQTNK